MTERFVKKYPSDKHAHIIYEKITPKASDDSNAVRFSGALVVSEGFLGDPRIEVRTVENTQQLTFNPAGSPKFRKKYRNGKNAGNARLETLVIQQGSGTYELFISGKEGSDEERLVTIFDRQFLEPSADLVEIKRQIEEMNCQDPQVETFVAEAKKNLEKLTDEDKLTEAYVECTLLLRGLQLSRPWETQGKINDLQLYYKEIGKPENFQNFSQAFKRVIAPHSLANHGFTTTFESLDDHDIIWSNLSKHFEVLETSGYQLFLNSGTLLGAIRDQRLIGFDDDIDLCIVLHSSKIEDVVQEWLDLKELLKANGLLEEEGVGIYKLPAVMGFKIDLFPAWFEDGKAFIFPYCFGELSTSDILPLEPWGAQKLLVPKNSEAVLSVNYDDNWRIPDPYFRFNWKTARRKFAKFLQPLRLVSASDYSDEIGGMGEEDDR